MDIWLLLYALTFLFAIPRIKWHRKARFKFGIVISDPSETRYMRNDKHTINGLYTYKLSTTGTTANTYQLVSPSGVGRYLLTQFITEQIGANKLNAVTWTFYLWGVTTDGTAHLDVDVIVRTSGGSETVIGNHVANTANLTGGWVEYSSSWACPVTSVNTTDAVVVKVYGHVTAYGPAGNVAVGFGNTGGYNSRILNFTWTVVPNAPTNCSVSVLSETSLRVSWTDASTDEDDFHVERKEGAGSYSEVQVVTSTTKAGTGTVYTWDNSGLLISTTYYYRVRAHRHSDNEYSLYSNEAYNTTPFYAPTNLVAISLNIDAILVQWDDNSQVESDYHLERKTSLEPTWAERTTVPANSTQFTDPGLDPAIIYTYRVRAHNHAQNIYTTYSNEASEAPKLLAQIPFNPFTPLLGYY